MRPKSFLSKAPPHLSHKYQSKEIREQTNPISDPQRVSESNTLCVVDVKTRDATRRYQEEFPRIQKSLMLSILVKIKAYWIVCNDLS